MSYNDETNLVDQVQNSLVQIISDCVAQDYLRPWKTKGTYSITGTGFCIAIDNKKYILTNAHCVRSSILLRVQAYGCATKYIAKIAYKMPSCDLAILNIEDDSFWKKLEPMEFSYKLPKILSTVYVIGYPLGGDNLSFTKGVVSRIINTTYSCHGGVENMGIQIDAAINSGNSGGPAIDKSGKVVGIAFQGTDDAENMGEIIPSCVYRDLLLHYFNNSISNNETPELGANYLILDNPDMRKHYKMTQNQSGVLIINIWPLSSIYNILLPGDIIMKINNIKVENDGTIHHPDSPRVRISFQYLITNHPPDKPCHYTVLRNGEVLEFNIVPKFVQKTFCGNKCDASNQYLIVGGCVFLVPTKQLASQRRDEKNDLPTTLSAYLWASDVKNEDSQIIILNAILPDEVNAGYEDFHISHYPLTRFNGQKVQNLGQLATLIDNNILPYIKFEFESMYDKSTIIIVMDTEKVKKNTPQILSNNKILFDRSEDLRKK